MGLATATYVLAGLAIGGVRAVAAGVAVMLTCWGARAGVVGMPAGWVISRVGGSGSGSATGVVGAASWVVGSGGRGRLRVSTGLW